MVITTVMRVFRCVWFAMFNKTKYPRKMKCIEQVDAYIKNLKSKPTKRVEKAVQSIAMKLDDVLAKGYDIKWQCYQIENSQAVSIVDIASKPCFVYRIKDKQEWIAVFDVFYGICDMDGKQGVMFSELDSMMRR